MLEQPEFGRRLRQLRRQLGKSQADLTGPGMSAAYLSRLESGARPPTRRAIEYLVDRLGLQAESFDVPPDSDLADILAASFTVFDKERDAEMRTMLQNVLDEAVDVDPQTRWQALSQLARLHGALGDYEDERDVLQEMRDLSDVMERPLLRVHSRIRFARTVRNLGDAESARQGVREALELSERHRLHVPATELLRSKLLLASVEAELGNLAEAVRQSSDVIASLPRTEGALAAESFWVAATVQTRLGHYEQATAQLQQALAALDSREDLTLWMRLRLAAASLALQAGPPRIEEADACLRAVEPALGLAGTPRHHHEYLFLRAQLAFQKGETGEACELCRRAEEGLELLSYRDRIRLEVLRGLLDAAAGNEGALPRVRNLAAQVQQAGMLDLAAEVWRAVAEAPASPAEPSGSV
ncbi:helix-turn-helix domain-containing protein [Streptomyces sp. NBC_00243]|uniref:helix-turn-helix domain-containing protein n=1 Tax=Streptomyces sp. NBC_00243 TaxID=2975688 RepID=UPI002DD7F733|nr:helix-turn-helix domain-containing protein [Streptomyces sp. NBC_00243]WRZ24447.1 helix-turn-helix domain-containing protein [Streptomyces sp. NBC_00243]